MFIPIRGERVDGHSFIPAVMEAGALAFLSEQKKEYTQGPYILVDSTKEALKKIAAFYRQSLDIKVVGITGSVGKTSTKEMIASVLKEKYRVHKTAGNFNNEIGLPLTIFDITKEHEVAVLEMGISDFGEMHRLAEIANPDICVITNIGLCHLENLGSRDGILKAKTEVFDHLRNQGIVILNGDDDKLAGIREVNGKAPMRYGKNQGDAYAAHVKSLGMEGIRMMLSLQGEGKIVTIPIPGEHNVYNALAAACVGAACGMDMDAICRGIDVLSQAPGRKIAVLGDMGELGEAERSLHAEIGRYAAMKQIDFLYCTGELSKEMIQAAEDEETNRTYAAHFESKADLIDHLRLVMQKGDTLLVKASHFMEFSKIVEALTIV